MDPLSNVIGMAISIVCFVFLLGEQTEKAWTTFAGGFLGYRTDGWPRGVQEGEPVAWDWSAMADRSIPAVDRAPAPDTPAEVFELDDGAVDLDTIIDGHIGRGTSLRR